MTIPIIKQFVVQDESTRLEQLIVEAHEMAKTCKALSKTLTDDIHSDEHKIEKQEGKVLLALMQQLSSEVLIRIEEIVFYVNEEGSLNTKPTRKKTTSPNPEHSKTELSVSRTS